ncbi:thermonuclease family protein [Profundibacterium mesophilum]|uniref:Succinoglycan biosynthesis protein n=1 Tax=Profundibacterium mesophilum KAUST100406-0324 TaxID=1037889 RepID=A0A921TC95_9RHOB|nr:thermonuclease family protein [Profundibacterium mesophilum]KAF0675418.1 Succinoglycan biosynthesis protein [Profundibacterium mesophilum KAUST100406-0324]
MLKLVFIAAMGAALAAVFLGGTPSLSISSGTSSAGTTQELSGRVRVVDGDTIAVGQENVRLLGIDAVEKDQTCRAADGGSYPCGVYVTDWLRARAEGRRAVCEVEERDRYGRHVALCRIDGDDIAAELVEAGLATAYRRYSVRYVPAEDRARENGIGFWAGSFEPPSSYRRSRIEGVEPPGACKIKGNISANGKIYHVPGARSYDRTGIKTEEGERWFCTESEARAAGWRAARGGS